MTDTVLLLHLRVLLTLYTLPRQATPLTEMWPLPLLTAARCSEPEFQSQAQPQSPPSQAERLVTVTQHNTTQHNTTQRNVLQGVKKKSTKGKSMISRISVKLEGLMFSLQVLW